MKELTKEEKLNEMGWTTVCESPHELEHEDGSTATGQSADIMVHHILQEWEEEQEEKLKEAELKKEMEATSELNLEDINGNEIIDFLNDQLKNTDEFEDTNISHEFKFQSQRIDSSQYVLTFSTYYNNWGTDQLITDNEIRISNVKIGVFCQEPLDCNGSDDIIEDLLREWIKTHKFKSNDDIQTDFYWGIEIISNDLNGLLIDEPDKMDEIIEALTKARALMK